MAQDAAKLHILQANLESVVGQLDAKTNEVAAATQEAATQKALVQQITKKLDVLSKRCKTLEQENTRMAEAQVGRVEAEVQTEPDAVLLRAQAETAAAQESLRDAKADWDAMAAGLQAQAAQEAVEQLAALEVANEARHALEAELQQANERAASAASESAAQRAAEAARAADQDAQLAELRAALAAGGASQSAEAELRREAEASLAAERERTSCEGERAARLEAEAAELTRQLKQAREELKAKDANCQSLTEDLVDTATRERSLESQLARLGGAEVQAGAQAEQVEHGKDASATSVAEELAHAQAAIEEHKSAASHWMRSCKQVQADAQKQGAELAARNTALRSLGAQLLQLREELGVERQASAQLHAKMQEMSGDADGYQQTISVLQVALRSARGGQESACADGGGGASPAAAAAERDAAGGVRLDSETASAGAMAGESKGGQERGRAGLNVNSVGMHERLRGVKEGARSVTEGVKGGMKADAQLLVDGLGSVMRGVKSRGFPFGKQVATSLPPAADSADSIHAEAQSAPPEMQEEEPPAAPMLDEAPPASQSDPAPAAAPAPAPAAALPRVDSLERLLAEAPR